MSLQHNNQTHRSAPGSREVPGKPKNPRSSPEGATVQISIAQKVTKTSKPSTTRWSCSVLAVSSASKLVNGSSTWLKPKLRPSGRSSGDSDPKMPSWRTHTRESRSTARTPRGASVRTRDSCGRSGGQIRTTASGAEASLLVGDRRQPKLTRSPVSQAACRNKQPKKLIRSIQRQSSEDVCLLDQTVCSKSRVVPARFDCKQPKGAGLTGTPEGDPIRIVSVTQPELGSIHDSGIRSERCSTTDGAQQQTECTTCGPPATSPEGSATKRNRPQRGSNDTSHEVRCLSTKSTMVIVVRRLTSPTPSALRVSHPLSGLIPP